MLEEVMLKLDKDHSGTLTWDEFKKVAVQVTQHQSLTEYGKHSVLTRR
jgi:hypothetical protein